MATANNSMIDVQGAVCARIPDVADSDGDGNVTELVDDRDFDTRICRNWNDVPEFSEFTFFSHGENGAGTYNSAGVLIPEACNSAIGSESENCDNDATFSTETFLAHSPTTSGDFDDQLTNSLISWTYIWDNPPTDEKNIFNRARGNMAVGLDANNPAEEKMQIAGNLRAEAQLIGGGVFDENGGGKVQTVNVCDKDGDISPDNDPGDANCFDPAVIGGDLANTDRLHCPDSGHMVAGIVDGKAVCRSILLDTTASCPNLQYVVGFSVDPNTGTLSLNCRSAF